MNDPVWFSELERAFSEKRNGTMENDPAVKAAMQLMKMYQSYIQVGFTSDQATRLVCETVYATTVAALCNKK